MGALDSSPGGGVSNIATLQRVRNAGAEQQPTMLLGAKSVSASPRPPMQHVLIMGVITLVDTIICNQLGRGQMLVLCKELLI